MGARMAAKPYNGHHCWNCWNVALWIGNDEGLYNLALYCKQTPLKSGKLPSLNIAALRFANEIGVERTPDGAKYTHKAVKAALSGLE